MNLQIDELIELLGQCATDPECKSVLLTGLGGTFSHGLDLSLLAYDQAPEKQRKSAESLAASVRRLVRYLLDYPKVGIFSHVQVFSCIWNQTTRVLWVQVRGEMSPAFDDSCILLILIQY